MPPKSTTPTERPIPAKPTPPQAPIVGKPVVKAILTPDMRDRVIVVRRDLRAGSYVEPKQGTPFDGVDQKEIAEGYFFATAQYPDPVGTYVDEYYLKSRADQERYNFQIAYPYVDKNYPQITRTYICLRTDNLVLTEPDADASDPASDDLRLVDHKIDRVSDDPVLDAMFVKLVRVFERLPSPIIKSYKENQFQQEVTIETQEVVASDPPALSATVEESSQDRTGTAKAKNIKAYTLDVFPQTKLSTMIPSMTRELWLGGFTEEIQSQVAAGTATQPVLSPGIYQIDESQETVFKHKTDIHSLPLPQTRRHQELTSEFGGGVVTEQLDIAESGLTIDQGFYVIESHLRNLDRFGQVKMSKSVTEWPVLYGSETDPKYGIVVQIRKSIVPAGTIYPPGVGVGADEKFVDIKEHDKWRSIQIVSKVDPNTLPPDISWDVVEHLDLPPIINKLGPSFDDIEASSAEAEIHGPNTGVDGTGSASLTTLTRHKDRSFISRAFDSASAKVEFGAGGSFEIGTTRPFFGPVPAIVTRHLSIGPPPLGSLYGPHDILTLSTVTGMATIIERTQSEEETDGCDRAQIQSSSRITQKTVMFGPALVGVGPDPFGAIGSFTSFKPNTGERVIPDGTRQNTYQIHNNLIIYRHYVPGVDFGKVQFGSTDVGAKVSTNVNGVIRVGETDLPLQRGVVSEVRILLPPSEPAALFSGNRIVVKVQVEEWRLGVFATYITTVVVP